MQDTVHMSAPIIASARPIKGCGGSLRFSVVIPLYNKRAFVRRAVDSVLRQSFEDFELIVVDDGSTDDSAESLVDITDARFRLIRQENAGAGPARNRGILEARAEWIAFLDADDCWLPEHLFETASIIRAFPGASLVATGYREVRDVAQAALWKTETSKIRSIDYFLEAARNVGRVNSSNASVRREVVEKLGGFANFRAGEDLEYWARIALSDPVAISDRVTSIYVRGTGGVMEQLEAQRIEMPFARYARLEDISPSVAMLCRVAADEAKFVTNTSIRTYINSRVLSCVRGSLLDEDVQLARHFARLLVAPLNLEAWLMRAMLRLPSLPLLVAMRTLLFAKHAARHGLRLIQANAAA